MDELQILLAITVLYFTYRWWSGPTTPGASAGSSSSSSSSSNAGSSAAQRFVVLAERIPSDAVAQARAMFPQLSEREIRWEFVRTGRLRPLETVVQALLEERQTPIVSIVCLFICSTTSWLTALHPRRSPLASSSPSLRPLHPPHLDLQRSKRPLHCRSHGTSLSLSALDCRSRSKRRTGSLLDRRRRQAQETRAKGRSAA